MWQNVKYSRFTSFRIARSFAWSFAEGLLVCAVSGSFSMGDHGKHLLKWRRGHPPLVPSFRIFSEGWFEGDEFDIWILKSSKSDNFYTNLSSFAFCNLLFLIFMSLSTFLPNMMVIEPFANSFLSSAKSDTDDRHDGNGGISPIIRRASTLNIGEDSIVHNDVSITNLHNHYTYYNNI